LAAIPYATYTASGYQYTDQTLTFGTNLVIDQNGWYDTIDGTDGYTDFDNIYNYDYGYPYVVNNGTINASGGEFTINPFAFTNNNAIIVSSGDTLYLNGSNVTNAANGAITVGAGSSLVLGAVGNIVVNDGAITVTDGAITVYFSSPTWNAGTLSIIGSTVNLDGAVTGAMLIPFASAVETGNTINATEGFTNDSAIEVFAGETLSLGGASVVNNADGSITVDAGGVLVFGDGGAGDTTSNAGTITATDATVSLYLNETSWTGALAITDSIVNLYGEFTLQMLSPLAGQGDTLSFFGTLDNTGQTISVGPGTTLGDVNLVAGETILNGTIQDGGSGIVFQGGSLEGLTYDGTLDLTPPGSSLSIVAPAGAVEGLTAMASDGVSPGAINLGDNSIVTFDDTQTFDNATITLEGNGSQIAQYVTQAAYVTAGNQMTVQTLTLGPNLTIDQVGDANGGLDYLDGPGGAGPYGFGAIDNMGAINGEAGGGQFLIDPDGFTNDGQIVVSNGDALFLQGSNVTNAADGTITVYAGSSLTFGDGIGSDTTANAGTIAATDAYLTFYLSPPVWNTGSLAITDSVINLYGPVTGATLSPFAAAFPGSPPADNSISVYDGFTNDTTVEVFAGETLSLGGPSVVNNADGAINVDPGGELTFGDGIGSDMIANAGSITATDAYLTFYLSPPVWNTGTLAIADSVINLYGPVTGATLSPFAAAFPGSPPADNSINVYDGFTNDTTVEVFDGETLSLGGPSVVNNADGAINVDPGGALTFGDGFGADTVANAGSITANFATLGFYLNDSDPNWDTGSLSIANSTVNLYGNLNDTLLSPFEGNGNTVNVFVAQGATVEFEGADPAVASVEFASTTGTLQLDSASSQPFTQTISGFNSSDLIDFRDIDFISANQAAFAGNTSGGTLTVSDGIHTANVALSGQYTSSAFVSFSDGFGGTMVIDPEIAQRPPDMAGALY
jgi:hypothetical protein